MEYGKQIQSIKVKQGLNPKFISTWINLNLWLLTSESFVFGLSCKLHYS